MLRILYQDSEIVAVDKPAGFHTHPPEDERFKINLQKSCLQVLRNQLGQYVYPIHRLDRATSGVLLFGLNSEVTHELAQQFIQHTVTKTYLAFVRGWVNGSGSYTEDLGSENNPQVRMSAHTDYECLTQVEWPYPVGKYSTCRYSLVKVIPRTGRLHQIRRHFTKHAHPLIGDTTYGDSSHNHFIREHLKSHSLYLKAYSLEWTHPRTQERIKVISRYNDLWLTLFDHLGVCPYLGS